MKQATNFALCLFIALSTFARPAGQAGADTAQSNYHIQDSVMIPTRDGAVISAIVVRQSNVITPQPAILQFTIYVRDKGRDLQSLRTAADSGYVGVIAYTRGKRYSPDAIFPYEHEANDAYDVIDWISKQSWCNGSIGMFGGSYNGFSQWAACKQLHPALKTIVPYVANRPGMGVPMENNIFINPNYEWAFYVGNNKYLDTIAGNDRQRFRRMMFTCGDPALPITKWIVLTARLTPGSSAGSAILPLTTTGSRWRLMKRTLHRSIFLSLHLTAITMIHRTQACTT